MNLVLLYIHRQPLASEVSNHETVDLFFGLPLPAFWMLVGIWVFPVLLWPLGFALTFKQWMRR